MCLDIFFTRGADKSRLWFNLSYTTALFIIGTIGNAANLNVMQISFINNRGFPGGPAAFQVVYYTVPIQIVCMVFFSVGTWMQDAYLVSWSFVASCFNLIVSQLYRFLLFWNFNLWLAIFPALIFMGVVGMCSVRPISTISDWSIATGTGFMYYALHPGSSILNPLAIKFGTSFFSLSVALNLILTLMIIGRLLYLRQSIRKALGRKHAERYTSIIAMLIESSSLYTTLGLIYIILYALGDPAQNFFLPALGVAEVCSSTGAMGSSDRTQVYCANYDHISSCTWSGFLSRYNGTDAQRGGDGLQSP
jgi:hypothetical protein